MTAWNRGKSVPLAAALFLLVAAPAWIESPAAQPSPRGWPTITAETKPWTRWWWQGSAVDTTSLTSELEALAAAGLGGVELTPIYGVRGTETQFIPYLSRQWMSVLDHTLREATRLRMGVDMATGTGWPFGGPWVDDDTEAKSLAYKTWTLAAGQRLTEPVRLRQEPLVRAIGNQIHVVNEGTPGDAPRGAASSAPVIRPDAQAIQITDLVEPVSANRNLQMLALEQVKYPRDLPLTLLMAYSDTGDTTDLTSRVQPDGRLDWTAPQGRWTLYALLTGRHGRIMTRRSGTAHEVYLQIPAGASLIVAESPSPVSETFDMFRTAGDASAVVGPWALRFLKGGPRLPSRRIVDRLVSWTTFGHDAEAFSGTASYTTTFARPKATGQAWQLDLGRVAESARVRLNGRDLATLIGAPYRVVVDASQLKTTNTLEVSVTNLSANRIRDLDVRGVSWKKFYNVNFPARSPENRSPDGLFTAARWEPLESGLLGPVTLTPLSVSR